MPLCSIASFWPKIAGSFCDADHENGTARAWPRLQSAALAVIAAPPRIYSVCHRSQSLRCGYDLFFTGVSWRKHESGMCAMDNELITQTKADREILSFDVSDELLERAANAEQSGFTMAYCTSYWDSCGLPTVAR